MSSNLVEAAKNLPIAERIQLVEALWESLAQEGYEPPLTPEQASELDRRLEAHHREPNRVIPWESIKADLMKKYQGR